MAGSAPGIIDKRSNPVFASDLDFGAWLRHWDAPFHTIDGVSYIWHTPPWANSRVHASLHGDWLTDISGHTAHRH